MKKGDFIFWKKQQFGRPTELLCGCIDSQTENTVRLTAHKAKDAGYLRVVHKSKIIGFTERESFRDDAVWQIKKIDEEYNKKVTAAKQKRTKLLDDICKALKS
jgi:hypothetical protein